MIIETQLDRLQVFRMANVKSSIISKSEIHYYHELGLGRGVNVTDPNMWKSKSPFPVRKICPELSNVITTHEGGVLRRYKTEVSTHEMQQQNLRLSLSHPASQVKIGMDEYFSRSSSSSKLIKGQKIETRTISFMFHLDDVPLYDNIDEVSIEAPDTFQFEGDNSFEESLASWFLKRIKDREESSETTLKYGIKFSRNVKKTNIKKLADKIHEYDLRDKRGNKLKNDKRKIWQDEIQDDCMALLKNFGITHYVSAIKLGACCYYVATSKSRQISLGGGTTLGASSLAEGEISGGWAKQFFRRDEEEQKIGRMDSEKVTEEAVIGFEVAPIYKLIRIPFIQVHLRYAISMYIKSKEDKSEGPFLISAQVGETPIFWTVNDSSGLEATKSVCEASLFYTIPADDATHPCEFYVGYWGTRGRQYEMLVDHLYRTYDKRGPPLPQYLSTDTNVFGRSKGPLSLRTSIEMKKARFSLHSRVQSSSVLGTSKPVTLTSWLEGEQFYIKPCPGLFSCFNGYLAINYRGGKKYEVSVIPSTSGNDLANTGMLFRLHPKQTQEKALPAENLEAEEKEKQSAATKEPYRNLPLMTMSALTLIGVYVLALILYKK